MNDNPYSKMIEIMRNQGSKYNPPSIMLGEVVSPQPNLIIKTGGIQLLKDDLLIAEYLLKDYLKQYQTSSNKSEWSQTNYIKWVDGLKSGDMLAIMPTSDKQTFIVLCKVVSL